MENILHFFETWIVKKDILFFGKKYLRRIVCFLLFLVASISTAYANVVESVESGWYWDNPDTWVWGELPTNEDDVVLNWTIEVYNDIVVKTLKISTGAVLQRISSSQSLMTNIEITNSLLNYWMMWTISYYGDFVHNVHYSVWTNLINYGTIGIQSGLEVQWNFENYWIVWSYTHQSASMRIYGDFFSDDWASCNDYTVYLTWLIDKNIYWPENCKVNIIMEKDLDIQNAFVYLWWTFNLNWFNLTLDADKNIEINYLHWDGTNSSSLVVASHSVNKDLHVWNEIVWIRTNFENIYAPNISSIVWAKNVYVTSSFSWENYIERLNIIWDAFVNNATIYWDVHITSSGSVSRFWAYSPYVSWLVITWDLVNDGNLGVDGFSWDYNHNIDVRIKWDVLNSWKLWYTFSTVIEWNLTNSWGNLNIKPISLNGDFFSVESNTCFWKEKIKLTWWNLERNVITNPFCPTEITLDRDITIASDLMNVSDIHIQNHILTLDSSKELHIDSLGEHNENSTSFVTLLDWGEWKTLSVNSLKYISTDIENIHTKEIFWVKNAKNVFLSWNIGANSKVEKLYITWDTVPLGQVAVEWDVYILQDARIRRTASSYAWDNVLWVYWNLKNNWFLWWTWSLWENTDKLHVLVAWNFINEGTVEDILSVRVKNHISNSWSIYSSSPIYASWDSIEGYSRYKFSIDGVEDILTHEILHPIPHSILMGTGAYWSVRWENELWLSEPTEKKCINVLWCIPNDSDWGWDVKSGWGGAYWAWICASPIAISHIKTEVWNNWFLDYIQLSWEKTDDSKIKIIKYFPEYTVIYPEGNSYTETGIAEGQHHYFIVSYSDCSPWIYSDPIQIDYKKSENITSPILLLNNKTLSLEIPETIVPDFWTKYLLRCSSGVQEVLKTFMDDKKYILSDELLDTHMNCFATFFDREWELILSQLFVYVPALKSKITNQEALSILYASPIDTTDQDILYRDIVTIESSIPPEAPITYGSVALMLSNISVWTYIEDVDIAVRLFSSFWLYSDNVTPDTSMTYGEFLKLYSFILPKKNYYQQKILEEIDTLFVPTESWITEKLLEYHFAWVRLEQLKKIDAKKYTLLKQCFWLERCQDRELYKTDKKVIDEKVEVAKKKLVFSDNEITDYSEFVTILYQVMWNEEFINGKYAIEEYQTFSQILTEAVFDSDQEYKVWYQGFYRTGLWMLWDEIVTTQVQYLTKKHLRNINKIYNTDMKDRLLHILSNYLHN